MNTTHTSRAGLKGRFFSVSSALLLRFKCASTPLEVCFFSASSALLFCFKYTSALLQVHFFSASSELLLRFSALHFLEAGSLLLKSRSEKPKYASFILRVLSCSCLANIQTYNFYLIVTLLEHYHWVKQKIETTLLFNKRRQRQSII